MSQTDDLASKITELLNDPDGMENIKNMAQSLLGDRGIGSITPTDTSSDLPDTAQMAAIMSMVKQFQSTNADSRTRLLMALHPHLSQHRQERLDKAVKLLKLYTLLPIIQQSGLFNL